MDNFTSTRSDDVTHSFPSVSDGTKPSLDRVNIPEWVPEPVQRYLTHTQAGLPIREVARRSGCHASTVLRQIRRIEVRRDDPLVDRALHLLSSRFFHGTPSICAKESSHMARSLKSIDTAPETPDLDQQTKRILTRLCETGAVLAVAEGMETAVVVREGQGGRANKTASLSAEFVAVLALNAWVECKTPGRISRYSITPAGRTKLADLTELAAHQSSAGQDRATYGEKILAEDSQRRRIRYSSSESPVAALSRRKDRDGSAFLSETLVDAAERLREDFELAQMGPRVTQNWDNFLTSGVTSSPRAAQSSGAPGDANERVAKALRYLGPGLGDVALRCCCYLEGLERAEKRMGWSARSGKIVLRIALERLRQFYETELGDVLIG